MRHRGAQTPQGSSTTRHLRPLPSGCLVPRIAANESCWARGRAGHHKTAKAPSIDGAFENQRAQQDSNLRPPVP